MTDRKFRLEDLTFSGLDFDDMTAGEIVDFIDATGWSISDIQAAIDGKQTLPLKAIVAGVWIINRRTMKGLTLEDIREIPFKKLIDVLTGDDDRPKELSTSDNS